MFFIVFFFTIDVSGRNIPGWGQWITVRFVRKFYTYSSILKLAYISLFLLIFFILERTIPRIFTAE